MQDHALHSFSYIHFPLLSLFFFLFLPRALFPSFRSSSTTFPFRSYSSLAHMPAASILPPVLIFSICLFLSFSLSIPHLSPPLSFSPTSVLRYPFSPILSPRLPLSPFSYTDPSLALLLSSPFRYSVDEMSQSVTSDGGDDATYRVC